MNVGFNYEEATLCAFMPRDVHPCLIAHFDVLSVTADDEYFTMPQT